MPAISNNPRARSSYEVAGAMMLALQGNPAFLPDGLVRIFRELEGVAKAAGRPVLVHGWPIIGGNHPDAGKRFGHAWIEFGAFAWDPISLDVYSLSEYLAIGKIEYVHSDRHVTLSYKDIERGWGPWGDPPVGIETAGLDPVQR